MLVPNNTCLVSEERTLACKKTKHEEPHNTYNLCLLSLHSMAQFSKNIIHSMEHNPTMGFFLGIA